VSGVTALDAAAKGKLAERMVPVAAALACAVREEDAGSLGALLDPFTRQELYGLAVALAAMVPVDEPLAGLLAWVTWDEHGRPLPGPSLCGTYPAYARHVSHDEPVDPGCETAARVYWAKRKRKQRRVLAALAEPAEATGA
jgi:hypothetical protein